MTAQTAIQTMFDRRSPTMAFAFSAATVAPLFDGATLTDRIAIPRYEANDPIRAGVKRSTQRTAFPSRLTK